uniref:Uncharacterized protein n=1 Tax=Ciona savignyi TaxID=51511 RepID=H2YBN6_CIOSA
MIVTGAQTSLNPQQIIFQQQLLKQRQMPQQQARQVIASKQSKAVYTQQLVGTSQQGTTAVKMPQIQAQVLSQIMQQQQQQKQRRNSNKVQQQPVALTVTKLLQNQSPAGAPIRHTLVPQSSQISQQQITQLPISVAATIVSGAGSGNQQQRLLTQSRQSLQIPRVRQIQLPSNQMVVASTPVSMQRPPTVVTVSNQKNVQLQSQLLSQQVHIRNLAQTVLSPTSINLQGSQSPAPTLSTTVQPTQEDPTSAQQVVTLSTSQESQNPEIQYTLQNLTR